jgi:hypothetical protein
LKYLNALQTANLAVGAHIVSPRLGYLHHGLYCGEGRVVHYSGMARLPSLRQWRIVPRILRISRVEEISMKNFCQGYGYRVVSHRHAAFTGEEVVRRARSRVGEHGYAIFSNNCEHFVNWCIEGAPQSWLIWKLLLLLSFSLGGLRVLQGMRVHRSPAPYVRALVRSGIFSLMGASAMAMLTRRCLRGGLRPGRLERMARARGRTGALWGLVMGTGLSLLGLRTRMQFLALLGPFVLPPLLGLLAYLHSVRSVWRRKKLK